MTGGTDHSAIVRVDRARAGYRGPDVLKEVSLEFKRREVFALLGPNGAGKSTLIRVLTGALPLRSGQVEFLGETTKASVGLVPQEVALYPWLSPRENCIAFARLSGLSRAQCLDRIGPVLKLSGCQIVGDTPVSRLSGGYQRRANVAAALMSQPDLLILDEPTAGLDADGRHQVAALIAAIRETGAAILLVTHELEFAESLADRIGILAEGTLLCCGELRVLLEARLGQCDRVEFVLKEAPETEVQARLSALGARPTAERRTWRLWRRLSGFDTRHVMEELDRAGLQVAEMRVRSPGLEDLFALTTAKEVTT